MKTKDGYDVWVYGTWAEINQKLQNQFVLSFKVWI